MTTSRTDKKEQPLEVERTGVDDQARMSERQQTRKRNCHVLRACLVKRRWDTRVLHRSGAFHSPNSTLLRRRRRRAQLTNTPQYTTPIMAIHPEVLWAQRSSETDEAKVRQPPTRDRVA